MREKYRGVAEWIIATVLKTVGLLTQARAFESHRPGPKHLHYNQT